MSKASKRQSRQQISFSVQGYKAIRAKQTLEISPITIVSGANSSGKSSFMQAFLLLKQTLDSPFDPGALLLHGPNVKVTDGKQIFSRGKSQSDSVDQFTVTLARGNDTREITYHRKENGEFAIQLDSVRRSDRVWDLSKPADPKLTKTLRRDFSRIASDYLDLFPAEDGEAPASWEPEVRRSRCFLEVSLTIYKSDESFTLPAPMRNLPQSASWERMLQNLIHVPGLRGNPERSYPRSAVGHTFPGTFDKYVATLVDKWSLEDLERLAGVNQDLQTLGLTWKLKPRRVDDAFIELRVGRVAKAQQGGANDLVSVADVGFGVSQSLPVVVALRAANQGQIVYVEQPELHLHPRAQVAMATVIAQAALRGVLVVIETHSSLLIRTIQTQVARGELKPSDVSLNWFSREDDGSSVVTRASLDRSGRTGDWPIDFEAISEEVDWQFLTATRTADTN